MRSSRFSVDLSAKPPSAWRGILATVAVVAVGTGVIYPLKSVAPAVSLSVVYIPGVLLISTVWGWRLGLVCAVASALAFNFFHIPPIGQFDVAADRDFVALVVAAIRTVADTSAAAAER
jgi:two-component system, OmpR family, sensor histidine kinase KdpD